MSDAARPTEPIASIEQYRDLLERLNRDWRIEGYLSADASLARRVLYQVRRVLARLLGPQETFNSEVVQLVNTLAPILSSLEQVERYREALAARERRMETAFDQLRAEQQEIRTVVAVLRQSNHDLTRELSTVRSAERRGGPSGPPDDVRRGEPSGSPGQTSSEALSAKYVGFEDQFRGAQEDIAARQREYVEIFAGASDVLDVGCGRGEFLALLKERGVRARGIDVNDSMVEVCVQKGLDASKADALDYLRAQPEGSLGGLLAAQVVEHLDPAYLTNLLDAAYAALRPGAPIVLETINPACWFAFFESYVRDITHVRPLHPDTLKFLLQASGFGGVEIRYQAPYPEHHKLQRVAPAALGDASETLNANVDKLNSLLFTYLDYAAIARRT
ncbi:MAG TPA: methyltransferase domain-containing protein [Vicinamibacterales bacterium]|nr:methyltransferase domain-containing protein [Vicinamibacterales bacterium]